MAPRHVVWALSALKVAGPGLQAAGQVVDQLNTRGLFLQPQS